DAPAHGERPIGPSPDRRLGTPDRRRGPAAGGAAGGRPPRFRGAAGAGRRPRGPGGSRSGGARPARDGAGAAAPSRGLHPSGPLTVGGRARLTGENRPVGICVRRAEAAVRALRVHGPGEPKDVLVTEEVDVPRPGEGELLVRVRAAAVNFPDALLCRGMYQVRPDPPFTPGVELCADVVQAGPGV